LATLVIVMPLWAMLDDTGVKNGFVLFVNAGVNGWLGKSLAKLEEAFIGVSIPIKKHPSVSCCLIQSIINQNYLYRVLVYRTKHKAPMNEQTYRPVCFERWQDPCYHRSISISDRLDSLRNLLPYGNKFSCNKKIRK
jgi:hypothetical protein